MKHVKKAFTIIELLVALVIVSIILVIGFQAYTMVLVGKVKLMERAKLQKEAFFFSERLFQTIKGGGTLDYEEYFNRRVIEKGVGGGTQNGHYIKSTGFGNFAPGSKNCLDDPSLCPSLPFNKQGIWYFPYLCISTPGQTYDSKDGCFSGGSNAVKSKQYGLSDGSESDIREGQPQIYGQYAFQFWDYNSNGNNDGGDEDNDTDNKIMGDDDDQDTGNGPIVFDTGTNIHELYLLGGNKKTRTFFRWHFEQDADAKDSSGNPIVCNPDSGGNGCIGTIQFLKLDGKDWGWDDFKSSGGSGVSENDGITDTWIINEQFRDPVQCSGLGKSYPSNPDQNFVAGHFNIEGCWQNLFPDSLNVSDFKVFAYPNKDQELAWKENTANIVSPYVTIVLEIKPSWKIRRKIRGDIPSIKMNTTINLTDIFSK